MRSKQLVPVVVALAVVWGVLTGACGSKSSPGPVAPSASSAASATASASSGGARISGTVVGTLAPASIVGGLSAASVQAAASSGITIKVIGTNITTTVDPSGHFVLLNVPAGHVQLQITGSTATTVDVGDVAEGDDVDVTVRVSGSTAEVDELEDNKSDNNTVEIEGRVTNVTHTNKCPATPATGSIVVRNKTATVTASTTIRHGNTMLNLCDISIGDRVHVKATKSGTTLTAVEIMMQTSNGNQDPGNSSDHGGNGQGDNGHDQPGDGHGNGHDN